MSAITFTIPIATVNPLNRREHWTVRAKRVRMERLSARLALHGLFRRGVPPQPPYAVTLTRRCTRKFDSDAVPAALKAIRDEIANLLGVTDGPNDHRVTWVYADQEKGTPGVRVTIEAKP